MQLERERERHGALCFLFNFHGTRPRATFRRIVRSRSTEDFRWLPYVTTLLSTSLWTFYGLLKPGGLLVVTVNGAGAALEAAYVALYLVYAPRETKVRVTQ